MSDQEIQDQFDEYWKLFGGSHLINSIRFTLTEENAEELFGFKIREISSHIPISSTIEEQRKYIDNRLCRLYIIGSAFPILEGWSMVANKDTTFIAKTIYNKHIPFKVSMSQTLAGTIEIKCINDFVEDVENEYHLYIEYQEDVAEAFSNAIRDKPSGLFN